MDEDDYGTGDKQNLSKIYNLRWTRPCYVHRLFSNSEELEKSAGYDTDWVAVQFTQRHPTLAPKISREWTVETIHIL